MLDPIHWYTVHAVLSLSTLPNQTKPILGGWRWRIAGIATVLVPVLARTRGRGSASGLRYHTHLFLSYFTNPCFFADQFDTSCSCFQLSCLAGWQPSTARLTALPPAKSSSWSQMRRCQGSLGPGEEDKPRPSSYPCHFVPSLFLSNC